MPLKAAWSRFRNNLDPTLRYLTSYLKNPVEAMRKLPEWDWLTILILLTGVAALSGTARGVVSSSFLGVISGLILVPLSALIVIPIITGFFYYTFFFFFKKEVSFQKLLTAVVLANIPFQLLAIASPLLPPANLFGLVISSLLLLVACAENFEIPKSPFSKILGALLGIYLVFWILSMIHLGPSASDLEDIASPQSLDMLERELHKKGQ